MSQPTLLDRLRDSEILAPDKIDVLAKLPEARENDPRALAKVVHKRGWLTRYQINQVAAGRGKDLIIGYYLLLDRLGEGGMGQVFKAQHRHMDRIVALKLMRKEKLDSPNAVARFFQEVQAAARLTHPNIVIAFDAGQAGNIFYFSMEYVDGTDLQRLVRERGPLPVVQACDYIRQAAMGLQHAHEQGLVHRDIKPSNLLVAGGSSPVVKILDMGLARLGGSFESERNLTKMGQVLGTPDYLAPEQAIDARNVDIRADIYSLGCTLYFLLTGRAPFRAEALAELLLKHQMEPPPLLRKVLPDAPAALEALLLQMMAKKPGDRPATPLEVALAMEPLARGQSVPVPPLKAAPTSEDAWTGLIEDGDGLITRTPLRTGRDRTRDTLVERPLDRRSPRKKEAKGVPVPLIAAGIGGGIFFLVLLIAGVMLLMRPARPPVEEIAQSNRGQQEKVEQPNPAAEGEKQPEQPADTEPIAAPPLRDETALFDVLEKAIPANKWTKSALLGGGSKEFYDIPSMGALLVGLEVGIGEWAKRDVVHSFQSHFLCRKGSLSGTRWGKPQGRVVRLEAKPGYAIGKLTVRSGLGLDGLSVTFMKIDGQRLNAADSYDSNWVGGKGGNERILGGDGTPIVGIYGKINGQTDVTDALGVILLDAVGAGNTPAPASPSEPPASPAPPGLEVWSYIPPPPEMVSGTIFTADGKQSVSGIGESVLVFHDIASGKVIQRRTSGRMPFLCMTMSKDRKRILTGGNDRSLRLWDVEMNQPPVELSTDDYSTRWQSVAISPDGKYAVAGPGGIRYQAGRAVRLPNGRIDPNAARDIPLWNLETGKLEHLFTSPDRRLTQAIFTDDGQYVVACGFMTPVFVWELKTKKMVRSTERDATNLRRAQAIAPAAGCEVLVNTTGGLVLWDCATGREAKRFNGKPDTMVKIVMSPERRLAATLVGRETMVTGRRETKDTMLRLWDVAASAEVARIELPEIPHCFDFSSDGKYALLGERKAIRLIDLAKLGRGEPGKPDIVKLGPATGEMAQGAVPPTPKQPGAPYTGHKGNINSLAISPNGRHLVTGGEDGTARVWNAETGTLEQTFISSGGPISTVRFSPNGKRILALGEGRFANYWEMGMARSTTLPVPLNTTTTCGDISNDQRTIVFGAGNLVDTMTLANDRFRESRTAKFAADITAVVSLGDRVSFAVGDSQGRVYLWNAETRKFVHFWSNHNGKAVLGLASNPIKTMLVSVGADKAIVIRSFHIKQVKKLQRIIGHASDVTSVAISPDGQQIVTGSKDKTVKLWTAALKPLRTFEADGEVLGVAFDSNGKRVLSCGKDVRVWDLAKEP
jgi:serine/threonine protein kinase/WD40 repeat protein